MLLKHGLAGLTHKAAGGSDSLVWSDDFDGYSSGTFLTADADWTAVDSLNSRVITSVAGGPIYLNSASSGSQAVRNETTTGNDQAIEALINLAPVGGEQILRMFVRMSASTGYADFYSLDIKYRTTGSVEWGEAVISKNVSSTLTAITDGGAQNITAPAVGQYVRFEVIGTTLTAYVNGVSVATATDSAHSAGQAAIEFENISTSTTGFGVDEIIIYEIV